tara:strand:+ start:1730 stop:2779 length:1050 start_codon:yes stop_codon:yes gene_type:complete
MSDFFLNIEVNRIFLTIFFNILIFFLINFIFLKKNFLIDNKGISKHKSFTDMAIVPLSGGVVLLISFLFINLFTGVINNGLIVAIFFVGFLSDTQRLNDPKKRLTIQLIVILIFIYINHLLIKSIRIPLLDGYLEYELVSILFTTFCLLILINGSNFIDGINLQCSGYFFVILSILLYLDTNVIGITNLNIIYVTYSFLISFIFFNLFNKSYLGDGGAYLLSLIVGFILINFQTTSNVSPYFIVLLLWYPAFENFFSIIRRVYTLKLRPDQPDSKHLHHLLLDFCNKRFSLNKIFLSSLTGIFINLFNLIIFYIGTFFLYDTRILVILILFCIIIYSLLYLILLKIKKT